MNLREPRNDDVEVNLTPLIDVVFLLLIFFMVSTTFIDESAINLTLPESSQESNKENPEQIEITIDQKNHIYINGKKLVNSQLETVRNALASASEVSLEKPVIITADEQTPYQAVIDIMDAARQIGLLHITFATRNRKQQK